MDVSHLYTDLSRRSLLKSIAASAVPLAGAAQNSGTAKGGSLPLYRPSVKFAEIYSPHPGADPLLKYNHDVDIDRFKDRYLAAWNANTSSGEHVPGQFNYLSASPDFERWSLPVRLFTHEGSSENPVEMDNQWQPSFVNYHDEILYCAWCTFTGRRTFVSHSTDGVHWTNVEVPTAPAALQGQVVGFPTTHGLLTGRDVIMFPCSLPYAGKFIVGSTRYAAVLMSRDRGKPWEWSEPIEAESWSQAGENPAQFGGETIYLWEPSLFEQPDGKIGLLIRNSTAQDAPERMEKPHRMILYATSPDHGAHWTKARPIEVDSICSRMFALSRVTSPNDLLMVMNDWQVGIPQRISFDRYFLSLFCAPVCDPDLLLPGPVVQPEGGTAFYPNGFVYRDRLYLAYTYPSGIHSTIIDPLPEFSKPFLLPRGGRPGLRIEQRLATLGQRQSSLGVVLTAGLTAQPELRLNFRVNVNGYGGTPFTILTLGGKTRGGTALRAIYDSQEQSDVLQIRTGGNNWPTLGRFRRRSWMRVECVLGRSGLGISLDGAAAKEFPTAVLRKICFGGLYEKPDWPQGMQRASDVRIDLDSVSVS